MPNSAGWIIFSLSSVDFFQYFFFQKILSGIISECQTIWTQIRTDIQMIKEIWNYFVCTCLPVSVIRFVSVFMIGIQVRFQVPLLVEGAIAE